MSKQTPQWHDAQVPQDFLGSWNSVEAGMWRMRCRECGLTYDSEHVTQRYNGIGMHEFKEHGLDVPGINVGLLP